MDRTHVRVDRDDRYATITMTVPKRRNALALAVIEELRDALEEVAASDAAGVLLTGEGPVFSSGHDFADMTGRPLGEMRALLRTCSDLMLRIQQVPQVVLARVQGPALAGDAIDAETAVTWGLINRAVPEAELDEACLDLPGRATRGSQLSKAMGKQTLYAQMDLGLREAYDHAGEVMAASSQTADGQESMASFIERRPAKYVDR